MSAEWHKRVSTTRILVLSDQYNTQCLWVARMHAVTVPLRERNPRPCQQLQGRPEEPAVPPTGAGLAEVACAGRDRRRKPTPPLCAP